MNIQQLHAALLSVNATAIERGDKYGACDQIDNAGQPYQSQGLAELLAAPPGALAAQQSEAPAGYTKEWISEQWQRTIALLGDGASINDALRIFGNRTLMAFGDFAGMHKAFSEAHELRRSEMVEMTALRAQVAELEVDRQVLQSAGTHPAPCARYCESTAYEAELRREKGYAVKLLERIEELKVQLSSNPSAPDGRKLVPIEASDDMLFAAIAAVPDMYMVDARRAIEAAIAAAPESEQV